MVQGVNQDGAKIGEPGCFWCGFQTEESKAKLEQQRREIWQNWHAKREMALIEAIKG